MTREENFMNQQHQQKIRQRRHDASLQTLKGKKAYLYEKLVITTCERL